ncbi:hypothetical protein D3H55_22420 [Bacillus salacetis]|uniref:Uncharacterized protein n=1 Tax=Bacillus salacetis TaxID=2315464 RepID=A0A3A1QMC6_9BACI|nr:hypothetical protein D3H55_22420 [Bacillus salacetis]
MNTGEKSGTWDFSKSNNLCENSFHKNAALGHFLKRFSFSQDLNPSQGSSFTKVFQKYLG